MQPNTVPFRPPEAASRSYGAWKRTVPSSMRPLGWFGTLNALLIGFVKATPPDEQSWQNILSTQEARRRKRKQRQFGGSLGIGGPAVVVPVPRWFSVVRHHRR